MGDDLDIKKEIFAPPLSAASQDETSYVGACSETANVAR